MKCLKGKPQHLELYLGKYWQSMKGAQSNVLSVIVNGFLHSASADLSMSFSRAIPVDCVTITEHHVARFCAIYSLYTLTASKLSFPVGKLGQAKL